jgi:peptidoglycan/xylan/chitin deacetylase (PgdA/CDA1 family)
MSFLHENHYAVISLTEAVDIITRSPELATRKSEPETRNMVVLTFDDGFADFYKEAFPIIQAYGFSATVFLPTGFILDEECFFKGKRCLRWNEIRDLARSRIEFGSHTVTHPQLRDLDWNQVVREIGESRGIIEDKIGEKAESFSYPYAFPGENERLKERLKDSLIELGYKNGVTTSIGTAVRGDDPMFLRRIPINSDDDTVFFKAKLEGGYDWIQQIQKGYKILRKR